MTHRTFRLRALAALVTIALAWSADPRTAEAGATSMSCGFCLHVDTCPANIVDYDQLCEIVCGGYAGNCQENWGGGSTCGTSAQLWCYYDAERAN